MQSSRKWLALSLIAVLTVAYASMIVYANANSSLTHVLYAAFKYESQTPPIEWYTPEQLGVVDVIEYGENGSYWLHIEVDLEKEPFPLQREQPIFLYKDKFYQVSPFWVTPGFPEQIKQWQIPIGSALAVGWISAGMLYFRKKRK